MAYRSISTTIVNNAAGNLTIAYPSGLAADDIMVLVTGCDNQPTITWPSGFTQIQTTGIAAPDGQRLAAAWKKATGSESGNLTQSGYIGGSQDSHATALVAFSGIDGTTPVNQ